MAYAVANGASVINASWGGGPFSQALLDAVEDAGRRGVLVVAAAGNEEMDTDTAPHYPAAFQTPALISVGATNQNDARSSFSNVGRRSVDLGAPGTSIYSTVPNGGYDWYDGTSMATPHVAGAAALAKAVFPSASPLGLKALLLRTVDAKAALEPWWASGGRLNVGRAVACAGNPQTWVEAPAPRFKVVIGEPVEIAAIGGACGDTAVVSVSATANGTPVSLTAVGGGLYRATYVPAAAGPLSIAITTSANEKADTVTIAGDVSDNYRFVQEPYAWIDATAGGTRLALAADDGSRTVTLPFPFSLYGQSFTTAAVSSNGYVAFGSPDASEWRNARMPDSYPPNGIVAPYWEDLNPSAGGSIWTRTVGSAPNRRFVVAWVGVPHYWGGDATFQVVLEEATGDAVFQWLDTVHDDPTLSYGGGATIGLESADGTIGRMFSWNQQVLQPLERKTALRATRRVGSGTPPPPPPPPPPDTTPPAAPTLLVATGGDGRVVLDWADNGEGDLAGYRVYRLAGTSWTRVASPTPSAYTDTGLVNGTAQTYRVTAVDVAGNESAPSAQVSATPTAPSVRVYAPTSYMLISGTPAGGALASLAANDGDRLLVNAQNGLAEIVTTTRIAEPGASLRSLELRTDARNTLANATLEVAVYDWVAGAWVTIDGPLAYVTADRLVVWAAPDPARFVSSSGDVRTSIRGVLRKKTFRTEIDMVRVRVESD